MKRLFCIVVVSMTAAASATATPFCDQMLNLAEPGADAMVSLPSTGAAARCQISQSLGGGQSRHCHWTFPYRSAEASAAFTEILDAVSTCLGTDTAVTQDRDVSHPDTYDLQLFERNGAEFAVSLKDKAALAQTLVFLRLPIGQ